MKNPIVITLLAIHLFAYTDFSQVFKFPHLIQHYETHHLNNSSISFLDFLAMHYDIHQHGNKRDSEDMKLPFKKMQLHLITDAVIVPQFAISPEPFGRMFHSFTINYYHSFISTSLPGGLFRPPILIG